MKLNNLIILLAATLCLASCRKEQVAPAGPQGTTGTQGPAGTSGQVALMKEGYIEGQITGTASNGDPINESFKYEFFRNYNESYWEDNDGGYNLRFARRSDKESQNWFQLTSRYIPSEGDPSPYGFTLDFRYLKDLGNGKYLYFGEKRAPETEVKEKLSATQKLDFDYSQSDLTITNYSFNKETGDLSFNYEIDLDYLENYSGNAARIIGSVKVKLNKKIR